MGWGGGGMGGGDGAVKQAWLSIGSVTTNKTEMPNLPSFHRPETD